MSRSSLTEFALANPLYVWVIVLTCLVGGLAGGQRIAQLADNVALHFAILEHAFDGQLHVAPHGGVGRGVRRRCGRSRRARAAVRRRVGEATAALGAASGFGETRAAAEALEALALADQALSALI